MVAIYWLVLAGVDLHTHVQVIACKPGECHTGALQYLIILVA